LPDQYTDSQLKSASDAVLKIYDEMVKEVISAISLSSVEDMDNPVARKREADRIIAEVKSIANQYYNRMDAECESHATTFADLGAQTGVNYLESLGLELSPWLPQNVVEEVMDMLLVDGLTIGEHWGKQAVNYTYQVSSKIASGILEGRTISGIIRDVKGLGIHKTHAETLARTAYHAAFSQAQAKVYEANSDVVVKLEWSAHLDARTCDVCRDLNGRQWTIVDKKPVKPNYKQWQGYPPAHPRCRCDMLPITSMGG
jgi:SPP1 gp7 family putative phage head morphogenesis protein